MNSKPVRILLADDDKDDRLLFQEVLKEIPVASHLTTVYDGEQLMNHLLQNTGQLPDILFLDLNMPRKNGSECLSEIKLNPVLEKLPVIIFSTSYEEDTINRLYKSGALHYIRKPDYIAELIQVIHQALTNFLDKNCTFISKEKFVLNPNKYTSTFIQ